LHRCTSQQGQAEPARQPAKLRCSAHESAIRRIFHVMVSRPFFAASSLRATKQLHPIQEARRRGIEVRNPKQSASFYVTQKPPPFRCNRGRAVEADPGRNETVPGSLRQLRYKMAREPPSRERTPSRSQDRHMRTKNEALSEYIATFIRTLPHLVDLRCIQS
jgi:hypothetical protein